jgi:hypothetical protein
MHAWIALQLFHYPLCQVWVTIDTAYGNAGAHSPSLFFAYGRWGRSVLFLSINRIQIKRGQRFKDRLLIRYSRVELDEDVAGNRICLCTIYALNLSEARFYVPFPLPRPPWQMYSNAARDGVENARPLGNRYIHIRSSFFLEEDQNSDQSCA